MKSFWKRLYEYLVAAAYAEVGDLDGVYRPAGMDEEHSMQELDVEEMMVGQVSHR